MSTCVICGNPETVATVVVAQGAPPAHLCERDLSWAPMLRHTATLAALREAGPPTSARSWEDAIAALPPEALAALASDAWVHQEQSEVVGGSPESGDRRDHLTD